MSPYDDGETPPELLEVKVEGKVDVAHIVSGVVAQVRRDIDEKIQEEVEHAVERLIGEAVAGRVQAEVDLLLAAGFPQRDTYGRELPPETVRDLALEHLSKRDSYSGKNLTDTLVDDAVRREIAKVVQEEAERARQEMRKQVDAVIQAKLGETLRKALGIP